jgi:hypothetical protein
MTDKARQQRNRELAAEIRELSGDELDREWLTTGEALSLLQGIRALLWRERRRRERERKRPAA